MTLTPLGGDGSAELVPFGKYKGQPVEVLLSDRGYCDWLGAQPWFQQRYGTVYNIIFPAGSAPQDTPEHNAMQARFLDHTEALRLAGPLASVISHYSTSYRECTPEQRANLVLPPVVSTQIRTLSFESSFGWDVVISARVDAEIPERSRDYPESWTAGICLVGGGDACRTKRASYLGCEHRRAPYERVISSHEEYPSVAAELKPTVGEEYPTILRDVIKRRDRERLTGGWHRTYLVLADRVAFESVTLDQVKKIFATQEVTFKTTSELPDRIPCACDDCQAEPPDAQMISEMLGP